MTDTKNTIAERGKAIENAFFAARDRELIEALKKCSGKCAGNCTGSCPKTCNKDNCCKK